MAPPICIPIASVHQLKGLKGIGKVKAKSLIQGRKDNPGPSIRELCELTDTQEELWLAWEKEGVISLVVSEENCAGPEILKNLVDCYLDLSVWYHTVLLEKKGLESHCRELDGDLLQN